MIDYGSLDKSVPGSFEVTMCRNLKDLSNHKFWPERLKSYFSMFQIITLSVQYREVVMGTTSPVQQIQMYCHSEENITFTLKFPTLCLKIPLKKLRLKPFFPSLGGCLFYKSSKTNSIARQKFVTFNNTLFMFFPFFLLLFFWL